MRRIRIFLHVLYLVVAQGLLSLNLAAQTFTLDTIRYNGNPGVFINLVFMGDGFQSGQLSSYDANVQNLTNYLFTVSPFSEYKNYFNVFSIRVPSVDSGTDHPGTATDVSEPVFPVASVNTYFNSTFDYASIHRLLVPANFSAINSVLLSNFPLYDQKLMLVNSIYYGGSGGSTSTSSLNSSSYDILVHEIGHSFANLADEYYAGNSYAAEKVNMTQQTNPALVKWKNWIGYGGVGIYQHCCGGNSALWYRPHNSCKMRYLSSPFCPVCKEAIIERIHQYFGTPVISYLPNSPNVDYCSAPLKFSATLIKPVPNSLLVKWKLNGIEIAWNTDSITLFPGQLMSGSNTLSLLVSDTTALSRDSLHTINHVYQVNWTINYNAITPPTVSANGPTTLCQGDSVKLTSSVATTYLWSNGETTRSITVGTSGNYSVIVTQGTGCTATASSPVITVTTYTPPAWYLDNDNDGYYVDGSVVFQCNSPGTGYKMTYLGGGDCNDYHAGIHPGAVELCSNGVDDNCDGNTDEGCITLSLKIFIEGYYTGGGSMRAVVDPVSYPVLCDTVRISLHDPLSPYNEIFSCIGTFDINGNGNIPVPGTALGNNYYLAVHHRNAIETWSASPVNFNTGVTTYDFTDAAPKAYGSNQQNLGDGNFALWSGDITDAATNTPGLQDGVIESADYSEMENAVSFILLGYIPEDITGDGVVESSDYSLLDNNVSVIIFSVHP
jgi:hypothetical protein